MSSEADRLIKVIDEIDAGLESRRVDDAECDEGPAELDVLLAQRDGLRHSEVMDLETPGDDAPGIGGLVPDEPIAPSARDDGGRLENTLCVVAEALVEGGRLTDCSVDQVRLPIVRIVERGNVDLHRSFSLGWQIRADLRVKGLAADHENLRLAQDRACGTYRMVEGGAIHAAPRNDA